MPVAIEGEHLPTEDHYDAELPSGQDPGEDLGKHTDSLCRISLVVQTHSFISCPDGWSQTILPMKKPDVDVLGWGGYMWCAV